jgi:hypothetical protein
MKESFENQKNDRIFVFPQKAREIFNFLFMWPTKLHTSEASDTLP